MNQPRLGYRHAAIGGAAGDDQAGIGLLQSQQFRLARGGQSGLHRKMRFLQWRDV